MVRDRLRLHIVPFDELNVGGYFEIKSPEDRAKKIRNDYEAFMRARAEMVGNSLRVLAEGRNWPNEGD